MFRYLVLALVFVIGAPAVAESPSYDYIQAGYQAVDIDFGGGLDIDGDGYGVNASFEIGDSMFGFATYAKSDFDFGVDLSQWQAGLGYHTGLTDNTDFFISAAYVNAEVKASGFGSFDQDGYGASVGVRSNVSDFIELFGEVAYVDLGSGSDDTAVGGGICFNFTDRFALAITASAGSDITSYGAGARIYFGN